MMKRVVFHNLLVAALFFYASLLAVPENLDGTSGKLVYRDSLKIFHTGQEFVQGFVRLNQGFAVCPKASAFMDTCVTVSGSMDLGDTGTMVLLGNLYLDQAVTLTSGGNIKGKSSVTGVASTIFLGGDLKLDFSVYPSALHIYGDMSSGGVAGDLVIDGCGHTLDIADGSQIFVDTNVTLTLRNMTIRTSPRSLMWPAIQLAAAGSKLALDNVVFELGADFRFVSGQIFIHDEVAVTGTSAFIYNSPCPSYITSGATWAFEQGTTFSVAPATYTDIPITAGTSTSNNFIVMADQSSALSLNGCSLKVSLTGERLTKGMLLLDNKIAIDTLASSVVSGVQSSDTGKGGNGVAWSPDQKMVATNGCVYAINGNTFGAQLLSSSFDYASFSPDGRYLAVGGGGINFTIYRINGTSFSSIVTIGSTTNVYSISWSPDGKFVAFSNANSPWLRVYQFNGDTLSLIFSGNYGNTTTIGVAWNPNGRYLAYACDAAAGSGTILEVFSFDGVNFTSVASAINAPYSISQATGGIAWSPDGRFIAYAYAASPNPYVLRLYSFNGSSLSELPRTTVAAVPQSVVWGVDGSFLVYGISGGGGIYSFDGTNLSSVASSNGTYLAVSSGGSLLLTPSYLYQFTFANRWSVSQGFSYGLVLGNSAMGSAYDANVQVLSGATVKVRGLVRDDSA